MSIFNKIGFFLKDKSPEILVISGIACGVGAVVSAVAATPKALQAKTQVKDELAIIHDTHEAGVVVLENGEEDYTDEDYKKDLIREYLQGGWRIAKNYIPTLLLEGASIACILGGLGILKKRHAATLAILSSTVSQFDAYRARAKAALGDDKERELYYGLKDVEMIEEVTTTDKEGKTKTKSVKKTESYLDPALEGNPLLGPYAIKLDKESCPGFRVNGGDPLYMDSWLSIMEATLNTKLQMRGHLFLSEVLEELQITPENYTDLNTDIIHQVGWIDGYRDSYIDFGCFRYDEEGNRRLELVRGIDGCCYLSFNCAPILGLTSKVRINDDRKWDAIHANPRIEK